MARVYDIVNIEFANWDDVIDFDNYDYFGVKNDSLIFERAFLYGGMIFIFVGLFYWM